MKPQPTTCSEAGCDRRPHGLGLCKRHYDSARNAARRAADPDRRNTASTRGVAVRLADLRLAVEMASVRLRQAAIVTRHPHVAAAKGVTAAGLLDEALDILESATSGKA